MLKRVLLGNALFSSVCGLLMMVFGGWLSIQVPLPTAAWLLIGGGLLLFAAVLLFALLHDSWRQKLLPVIIGADVGWVVLTILGWLLAGSLISVVGVALIVAVNVVVGLFAWLQYRSYRRSGMQLA